MCAMRGWARKGPWGPEVDALAAACGWVRTKPLDRHGLSTPLELHCWEFDLQGPEINQRARASSLEGFCWLANPALLGHPTPQATPLLLEMGNKAMGDKVGAGVGGGGGKRGRTGLGPRGARATGRCSSGTAGARRLDVGTVPGSCPELVCATQPFLSLPTARCTGTGNRQPSTVNRQPSTTPTPSFPFPLSSPHPRPPLLLQARCRGAVRGSSVRGGSPDPDCHLRALP